MIQASNAIRRLNFPLLAIYQLSCIYFDKKRIFSGTTLSSSLLLFTTCVCRISNDAFVTLISVSFTETNFEDVLLRLLYIGNTT